jgi:tripartite-type tricarboxylate transporter receptor subunit TctC
MKSTRLCHLALLAVIVLGQAAAQAQYPVKPVRLIVPFPPGGSTDILARIHGQKLGEALGQQVIVDNRPGAAGNVGAEIAARAQPDGYTLLLANIDQAISVSVYDKLTYSFVRDLEPVTLLASTPLTLMVNASVPVKSVKELIAFARVRPNQLSYSAPGSGSAGHLAGVLFSQLADLRMVHVSFKGGAPAMLAVVSGEVALGFPSTATALPYMKSGRVRGLAVTSAQRLPSARDIPTVTEAGLPGYEIGLWAGLLAPAGTPRDVIARLHAESIRVLAFPDVRERLDAAALTPIGTTPEQFGAYIRREVEKWAKVVKASGVRAE